MPPPKCLKGYLKAAAYFIAVGSIFYVALYFTFVYAIVKYGGKSLEGNTDQIRIEYIVMINHRSSSTVVHSKGSLIYHAFQPLAALQYKLHSCGFWPRGLGPVFGRSYKQGDPNIPRVSRAGGFIKLNVIASPAESSSTGKAPEEPKTQSRAPESVQRHLCSRIRHGPPPQPSMQTEARGGEAGGK